MNGKHILCIRLADDIVLGSESEKNMRNSLTTFTKVLQEY